MLATVKKSLPNFDINKLAPRDYQGPKCSYAKSAAEDLFLF